MKSILNHKHDKWNVGKAQERLSLDLKLSRCFMGIFLLLFKGDLKKIRDEPFGTPFLCKFMSMLGLSYHVHK